MEIAVVGTQTFTLGFQLAGVTRILNPNNEEEMQKDLRQLLNDKEVGIVVIDASDLQKMPDRLRIQLSDSISPTSPVLELASTLIILRSGARNLNSPI